MKKIHGRLASTPTNGNATLKLSAGLLTMQRLRWLATWRLMLSTETLLVLASIAFSVFYNHAFWHALFG